MKNTLLLWDIDGTLLQAHGAGRRAMERAVERITGIGGGFAGVSMAGRTDPSLFAESAVRRGYVWEGRESLFYEWYLLYLREELGYTRPVVLPGVERSLETLFAHGGFVHALGTGNLREGARIKLDVVGLSHHFATGGFGEDHPERHGLLQVGTRRVQEMHGRPFGQVVVIGDTPLDVAAARKNGYRAVAVASSRFPAGELWQSGAHLVVEGLGDPALLPTLLAWQQSGTGLA